MVYAIEEMKIAAAGFAACGGTYGKGKREKAVLPPGGQEQMLMFRQKLKK